MARVAARVKHDCHRRFPRLDDPSWSWNRQPSRARCIGQQRTQLCAQSDRHHDAESGANTNNCARLDWIDTNRPRWMSPAACVSRFIVKLKMTESSAEVDNLRAEIIRERLTTRDWSPMLLSGIFPPITTPFYPEGEVYYKKIESNVERYSRTPIAGIVVQGSTGEAIMLSDQERRDVFKAALGAAAILINIATAVGAEFSTAQRRQTPSQPTDQTGDRLRARSADFSYPGCSRSWRKAHTRSAPKQHPQTPRQQPRRG